MDGFVEGIQRIIGDGMFQSCVAAALIIVATGVISSVVSKLLRKIMQVDGLPLPSSSIIINIARIVIWALGLCIMLSSCFSVDVNGLIAALGIGGVALSLGLQDTIKNFIGGLQVTLMKIVRPDDHVKVGEIEGIVQDVSWRQTVVKDYENNLHLIPNAVINSTAVQKISPDLLVVTRISFVNDGRDLDEMIAEMEQLAKRAIEKVAPLEKDPWILLTEIGEYGIWAKMRFVLKEPTHAREARDAALRAISPYTRSNASEILLGNGDED
ncbi:MAG: mechanosensitive ion channel [Eggerthellaceae bacterium]|nr:mechanosensitive ion channel [Eggerthellaceae bacterium]